jgi:dethiobiotin synthetase
MKPRASGGGHTAAGWRKEDALAQEAASAPRPEYADLNPYALPLPLAPELAAREAGVTVELATICVAYARLRAQADAVVVEGVGGWAAPLSASIDQADVVLALDLPVVMVVGLRLGCLNHAYLTMRAIAADGCRLAGWIGNAIDPGMARRDDNLALLAARIPAPCWGVLPHADPADPAALARLLTIPD